jgi:hypothetical protein
LAKKVYLLEQKKTLNISEAEVLGFEIGLAVGRHGLLGKQNQYDHNVRAPFIIAGKNIDKGKKIKGSI